MRVSYICDCCESLIASIEMDSIDERKLGLASLTPEEREDIIKVGLDREAVYISSICDACIESLEEAYASNYLH